MKISEMPEKNALVGNDMLALLDSEVSDPALKNKKAKLSSLNKFILPDIPDIAVNISSVEGWIRIARIPDSESIKSGIVTIRAVTAAGTITETTLFITIAHRLDNSGSIRANIQANTAHSFNSWTTAENGYVLLYANVSYDSGYWVLSLYKYVSGNITLSILPDPGNKWTWFTGPLTTFIAPGGFSRSVTLTAGFRTAEGAVQSADSAVYSSYGVLGGDSFVNNTVNNVGKWHYIGYTELPYNGSYKKGQVVNVDLVIRELKVLGGDPSLLDDFLVKIRVTLSEYTDAIAFNALTPSISMIMLNSKTLTGNDFCAVYYSSSQTYKYIRYYIKAPSALSHYEILAQNSYGRMYSDIYAKTTTAGFRYSSNNQGISTLPTPVSGYLCYCLARNFYENIDFNDSNTKGKSNIILGSNNEVADFNLVLGDENTLDNNTFAFGFGNSSYGSYNAFLGEGCESYTDKSLNTGFGAKSYTDMMFTRAFNSAFHPMYKTNCHQYDLAMESGYELKLGQYDTQTVNLFHNIEQVFIRSQNMSIVGFKLKCLAVLLDDFSPTPRIAEISTFEMNGWVDNINSYSEISGKNNLVCKSMIPNAFAEYYFTVLLQSMQDNSRFLFAAQILNQNQLAADLGLKDFSYLTHWTFRLMCWIDTFEISDPSFTLNTVWRPKTE